jgi:transcriptional regulator with XRE-family HTH domain
VSEHEKKPANDSRAIGEAFKKKRRSMGIHQADMALRAGMSARQLSRIEAGEALASTSLNALLKAMNVRLVVRLEREES